MTFEVAADAYGRFMGLWSAPLADQFVALAAPHPNARALDVGCGPGALTAVLIDRLGPAAVSAVDPSESFVAAARARFPQVDVRRAGAADLPFADRTFDLTMAQLVVHFMPDPHAGLVEMARVTRPGGVVAACVWDHAGGNDPLGPFRAAVRDLDPDAADESGLPGTREGHLASLFTQAGLHDVEPLALTVQRGYADFADWWDPFTLGVGPAGDYVATLDPQRRDRLRAHCAEMLPTGPFVLEATAWTAVGRA